MRLDQISAEAPPSREIRGLQALRGLAACMVVAYHATQLWSGHVSPVAGWRVWENGQAGVDIFFVISGVVMALTAQSGATSKHPARRFLERRMVRVVPLYWILTAVFLLKMLVIHHFRTLENSSEHVAISTTYVLSSLFFVPYRNSLGVVQPLLSVGWTLSFEMFFYLLFAAALALRVGLVRLLTPLMLLLALVGLFHQDSWPTITVLASPLLIEFLAGVWIGKLVGQKRLLGGRGWMGIGTLTLVWILVEPQSTASRVLLWGVPAMLFVLCTVLLERRIGHRLPRWMLRVGDASYSLYLSHTFVATFGVKVLRRAGLLDAGRTEMWGELTCVGALLVVSVILALVLFRWLEQPVNEALQRQLGLRKVQVSTAIV